MAQYKRIPFETVEHTELARKNCRDYEHSMAAPDEAEVEAGWIARRKMLRKALDTLTPRQRAIYIMRVGYNMAEKSIAERLHIGQSVVSRHLKAADKKLRKFAVKITDK